MSTSTHNSFIDVGAFKSFKSAFSRACVMQHPGQVVTANALAFLVGDMCLHTFKHLELLQEM